MKIVCASLILSCLFTLSCNRPEKGRLKSSSKVKVVKSPITNVIDISKDTILVVRGKRIELSINNGRTWTNIGKDFITDQLVLDDSNILWGIYYWPGIHEPKVSMLFRSLDFGKNWEIAEFNSPLFSPREIISKNHIPIRMATDSRKVYKFIGGSIKTGWKQVNIIKDFIADRAKMSWPPYHFLEKDNGETAIYKAENDRTDTIISLKNIGTVESLIVIRDTLLISATGYFDNDGAHPFLASIIKDKVVKKFQVTGKAINVYQGTNGRIWVSNYDNLFLKGDTGLIKFH